MVMSAIIDITVDYFKFILGFFVFIGLIIALIVPIGNFIPPFNDWFPFLKDQSILEWAQQYSTSIAFGLIVASSLFILYYYAKS